MATPAVHFEIAQWLEKSWSDGKHNLLLMAFRSCGKSTIAGLFCAWLFYIRPNIRILVLAADFILAGKMVRNVKRIIEKHPLTGDLKPSRPDQWAGDRFTVNRTMELRDPSMLAKGITSNVTGSRADVLICDDVEVPNTCDTEEKRLQLRQYLDETGFILTPGGTQLYIGTPHSFYSIYAPARRADKGESRPYLAGFHRLEIPILRKDGKSAWPEKFTLCDIEAYRKRSGPNKFSSQMMLTPVNITEGRLNPDTITLYESEPVYKEAGGSARLTLGDKRLVSASAWWDPSFARDGGDNSVFAVIYTDVQGHYYLHHIQYIAPVSPESSSQTEPTSTPDLSLNFLRRLPLESPEELPLTGKTAESNFTGQSQADLPDEATRQCRIVAQLARQLFLPSVTIEINGIGRFLPGILRRELARCGHHCAVIEVSTNRPKHVRILEAFDAVLAARALSASHSVCKTPFFIEMREWRPRTGKTKDDGLDAVAGALSAQPVRLGRHVTAGERSKSWSGYGERHRAKTDFDV